MSGGWGRSGLTGIPQAHHKSATHSDGMTLLRATATRLLKARAARFAAVGGATTLAYLGLYAVLHLWLGSQAANALALVLTADANTLANRRLTFGLTEGGLARTRKEKGGERARGSVAFLVSLVLTSVALSALAATGSTSATAQLVVLLAANLVAGVVHFLLLRSWAFAPRPVAAVALA